MYKKIEIFIIVLSIFPLGCVHVESLVLTIENGGCTDSLATNYNPLAQCDDGSCTYIATKLYKVVENSFHNITIELGYAKTKSK